MRVLALLLLVSLNWVAAEEPVARFGTPRFRVGRAARDVVLSPDGRYFAAQDTNRTQWIQVFDAATGRHLHNLGQAGVSGDQFAFGPGGRLFVGVSWSGSAVYRYEFDTQPLPVENYRPVADRIDRFVASHDGRTLVTLEETHRRPQVRAIDVGSTRGTRTFPVMHHYTLRTAISPDGGVLATWGRFHPDNHPEARQRSGPGDLVRIAFSPDGRTLAITSSSDEVYGGGTLRVQIRLWDIAKERERLAVQDITGSAGESLAYSPDGRLLAMEGKDGGLRILEADTLSLRQPGGGKDRPSTGVVFSPDGLTLASGLTGGRVALWETLTGRVRRIFPTEAYSIESVAFSPDGRFLASGDGDGVVLLWDLRPSGGEALTRERVPEVWRELEQGDGPKADAAMRRLIASPAVVVPWASENLKPITGKETLAARLDRLLRQLDAEEFETRQQAAGLLQLGHEARPVLARGSRSTSLEVRTRCQELLDRLASAESHPSWAILRGVEVLERIGSPEARAVLEKLAGGDPTASPTRAAKESLERSTGSR